MFVSPSPNVWGPSLWNAIHFIALGFPDDAEASPDVRAAYRHFYSNLHRVLPCGACSQNLEAHLRSGEVPPPPAFEGPHTRQRLFEWTVLLHNIVNRSLGKEGRPWTAKEAYQALLARGEEGGPRQSPAPAHALAPAPAPAGARGPCVISGFVSVVCMLLLLTACVVAARLLFRRFW
jgi:hypothetical protein